MQNTPMYRSSRTAIALMAAASALPVVITTANAGEGGFGMSGLAEREMIRRQTAVQDGDRLLNEGRDAYAKGDYQMAVDKYSQALQKVPDAPMFADRRQSYVSHLSDASVALAMQNRKVGKYAEARVALEGVLAKDPENSAAKRELGYLDDPIRTNPALTFEHTQNVDEVRRSLYMAEGNINLGKFDAAKKEYEKVLRIDRYNAAARRGLEQINVNKSAYYRAAYDHTRSELLMQVDEAWELAVPNVEPSENFNRDTTPRESTGVSYITAKLRSIIIPKINFEQTTVEEAINFLRQRSYELDTMELNPEKKGVNFVVRRPRPTALAGATEPPVDPGAGGAEAGGLPPAGTDPGLAKIHELRLTNVPIAVVLKYICDYTKLRYKVDDFAVTLVPQTETGDDLYTRTFSVPPGFQASLEASAPGAGEGGAAADPFAEAAPGGTKKMVARPPIKDLLKNMGIKFSEGASAALTASGSLIVTNTPSEIDKVEQVVNANIIKTPKQVKITTKFVEITQENSDELGFDWILSPFGITDSVFGSGGATGNGAPRTGDHFSGPLIPGEPAGGVGEVSNMMTNGIRSGDFANQRNSIDAILNNPNRTAQQTNVAPGIMALTGLFSDGQVKLIMRGLAQRKGTDLMTAPSVTAKSGMKATIEIIREFIYPTEYDPPQIPTQVGNNGNNNNGGNAQWTVLRTVDSGATWTAVASQQNVQLLGVDMVDANI
ncbi:MAG: Amuc_1098 family type IV pilus outer membrane protein, partial [Verrucomicrobiota bacterium]